MKKLIWVLVLFVVIVSVVVAFAGANVGSFLFYDTDSYGEGNCVEVIVDSDTGVNYLYYGGGICPRYNADGTIFVKDWN